jgi:hypothetical protein
MCVCVFCNKKNRLILYEIFLRRKRPLLWLEPCTKKNGDFGTIKLKFWFIPVKLGQNEEEKEGEKVR